MSRGSITLAIALILGVLAPIFIYAEQKLGPAEFYWLMNRACHHGDLRSVRFLLDAGADPSGPSDYEAFRIPHGTEPSWHLVSATLGGHTRIVQRLLEAGADPNLAQGEGITVLIVAAEHGHQEIVELVLKAGAEKEFKFLGETAEEIARAKGHANVANLIRDFVP